MRIDINKTVKEILAEVPSSTRVFTQMGIDYSGSREKVLKVACKDAGVPVDKALRLLEGVGDLETQNLTFLDRIYKASTSILAVIPEASERLTLGQILDEANLRAIFASTIQEARDVMFNKPMRLVICAAQLPDGTFSELLSLSPRPFASLVILCSGACPAGDRINALEAGILDYISRPLRREEVLWVIRGALAKRLKGEAGMGAG